MITFSGSSDDLVCVSWTTTNADGQTAEHSDEYTEDDEFLIGNPDASPGENANAITVSMFYGSGTGCWGVKVNLLEEDMPGFKCEIDFERYTTKLNVHADVVPFYRRCDGTGGKFRSCDRVTRNAEDEDE